MTRQKLVYLAIIAGILLVASALRVFELAADAPLNVSPYPGLSTDGATAVGPARDRIVFDTWAPQPSMTNLYQEVPGMSWLAYGFFFLLGVGYWQANLISVVTGLLSIVLIAAFAHEQFSKRVAIISALFMATSYVYIVYNRTPIVYTTLACLLALALYLWGKGLRKPVWFGISLAVAVAGVMFVKVLGIAVFPALILGIAVVVWRRREMDRGRLFRYGLLLTLSLAAIYVMLYLVSPGIINSSNAYFVAAASRSFNPAYGLEENVRFAIQSGLQFGIYSSFFVRMLPLFILSYGYVFYRTAQLATRDHLRLKAAEITLLIFTVTTVFMLMFSRSQATRYTILLIPPMCLTAALALDRILGSSHIRLPSQFNRLFPVLVLAGLAYLLYQVVVATLKLTTTIRLQTGFADYRAIVDAKVLFQIIGISLFVAMGLTLLFLWRVKEKNEPVVRLPNGANRAAIVILLVVFVVSVDLFQYFRWAVDPQYTILQASREIADEVGDDAIIGGTFAYPLVMENDLSAFYFVAPSLQSADSHEQLMDTGFTHIAIDDLGSPVYGKVSESPLFEYFPELRNEVKLLKTYQLRDNQVRIYEAIPDSTLDESTHIGAAEAGSINE